MARALPIAGDIVHLGDGERVVVDVTDDGFAVLRTREDIELADPVVAPATDLEIIGHLDRLEGWTEETPGDWSKA